MPELRIDDLECAAALHWQAPETERLGDWLLRAAGGFACGRISVAGAPGEQWGAITAVEVDPAWQRQGLGAALTFALAAAAAGRGARRGRLQVETGNAAARALYFRCGFRDSHRYHYMMRSEPTHALCALGYHRFSLRL